MLARLRLRTPPLGLPMRMRSFGGLVQPQLAASLSRMGISEPNDIQKEALPVVLRGDDLILCARTGMGKTLVFLVPFLERLIRTEAPPSPGLTSGPEALVLVPTDELALQISRIAASQHRSMQHAASM